MTDVYVLVVRGLKFKNYDDAPHIARFWVNGNKWSLEYPDAMTFERFKSADTARSAIERKNAGEFVSNKIIICHRYGMTNEVCL